MIVQDYAYSPFGAPLQAMGGQVNPLQYTGEQWHETTGLLYLRARWYDPAVGRFLTQDPFPGLPSQPQTLNPYPYVLNNPINLTDPSGEFPWAVIGGGAVVGGAIGVGRYLLSPGRHNVRGAAGSFVRGAVGGAAASVAFLGVGGLVGGASGLVGSIVGGALSGAAAGGAAQVVDNVLNPCVGWERWDHNVIPSMVFGAAVGGVFGGVSFGVRQWLQSRPLAVERNGLKFTEHYYTRLWQTGRKAPSLIA